MKKSIRVHLTGSLQAIFFEQFIKENADKLGVKGYLRKLENGKVEIFLEGNTDNVDKMALICKEGHKYSQIRNVEEKPERFQDFKDFRIMKI